MHPENYHPQSPIDSWWFNKAHILRPASLPPGAVSPHRFHTGTQVFQRLASLENMIPGFRYEMVSLGIILLNSRIHIYIHTHINIEYVLQLMDVNPEQMGSNIITILKFLGVLHGFLLDIIDITRRTRSLPSPSHWERIGHALRRTWKKVGAILLLLDVLPMTDPFTVLQKNMVCHGSHQSTVPHLC